MTYHFGGLDLSLTNCGVAVLRGDQADGVPYLRSVKSSPEKTGTKAGKPFATLLDRRDRIRTLAGRVVGHALNGYQPGEDDAPVFVIEAPFYGSSSTPSAATWDRAWLWGLVVDALFARGVVVEVSTGTMKRYATGSGGAGRSPIPGGSKAGVLLAMPRMFPQIAVTDDNIADALTLAAMGARALGHAREPSPQRVTPAALDAVNWPSNTARRNHA